MVYAGVKSRDHKKRRQVVLDKLFRSLTSELKAEQSSWYDVGVNEKNTKQLIQIMIKKGVNIIYIKTVGQGVFDGYSGDGFFYRLQ